MIADIGEGLRSKKYVLLANGKGEVVADKALYNNCTFDVGAVVEPLYVFNKLLLETFGRRLNG